jgi:hypothetical protein
MFFHFELLEHSTLLLKMTNLVELTLLVNNNCLSEGDWELQNVINQLTHLTSLNIPNNFVGQTFTKPLLRHYWSLLLGCAHRGEQQSKSVRLSPSKQKKI